jgi:pimeloyl-ACP methyl ester carboxylesterase
MIENKKVKENNEKYKELFNMAKYAFPTTYINSKTVPTLCQYGGDDSVIGVCHYSYLKEISQKYGNKIVNVYMKNSGHFLNDINNEKDLECLREMHYQILNFAKLYFKHEK